MPGIGAQGFVEGAAEIHVDFGQRVGGGQIRSFARAETRCLGRQFRLGGRLVVERLGKIEIVELEFRIEIIELDSGSRSSSSPVLTANASSNAAS